MGIILLGHTPNNLLLPSGLLLARGDCSFPMCPPMHIRKTNRYFCELIIFCLKYTAHFHHCICIGSPAANENVTSYSTCSFGHRQIFIGKPLYGCLIPPLLKRHTWDRHTWDRHTAFLGPESTCYRWEAHHSIISLRI